MIDKFFLQRMYRYSIYFSVFIIPVFFKYSYILISIIGGIFLSLLILKIIEIIVHTVLEKRKEERMKYLIRYFILKYSGVIVLFYFLCKLNSNYLMFFSLGIAIPYIVAFVSALVIVMIKRAKYA